MSFSNSEENQGREPESNDGSDISDMPDHLEHQAEQHQREMMAAVGVGSLPEDDGWRERMEHYERTGELAGLDREQGQEEDR